MTAEAVQLLKELKAYMNSRAKVINSNISAVGGGLYQPPTVEMTFEQRINEVLRTATAATKAEVYSVMFDDTTNPES